jgi:outer membrane receptor protein involved in Fe transport
LGFVASTGHVSEFKNALQWEGFMHMKLMSTWLRCFALILLAVMASATIKAQTITGSIRGTVTDPSGAVVPGSQVRATNVDTGVVSKTVANRSGLYNFQFLPIGNYKIEVTASGFDTQKIGPFALGIDQVAAMDAKLAVGRSSETVSVSGSNSLLDTTNSTISASISSETLENMPLNGLNVQIATLFVPGAINPNASAMGGQLGTERDAYTPNASEPADAQPSFNGNRQQSNSYILDGIDINETLNNALGYNPSPFSIQEVHVITGNADAEYGNVNGGEVVMVTKGGTNQFHGSLFEYHQASGLQANSYSNKIAGPGNFIQRAHTAQNQFGGAVGGPIFKDKLFFFANYLGLRHRSNGTSRLGVPTLAERGLTPGAPAGIADLSGLLAIEGTQLANNSIAGSDTAPLYVNNQVPITNPVASYLFATSVTHPGLLPLPNFPALANTYASGNYVGPTASEYSNDQGDMRLDYTHSNNNTFMLKVSRGEAGDQQTQMPEQALFPTANNYPFTNISFGYTHIFSPKLVNNFRAGFTRISLTQGIVGDPSGLFGINGDATVGIPFPHQAIAGFTYMALNGCGSGCEDISNFGTAYYTGGFNLDNNFDYNDTLTWVHGNHVTKFGVDFVRYQQAFYAPSNIGGQLGWFDYGGEFTNSDFGDFLTDHSDFAQVAGPSGPFGQRQWRDAVYVQDDWKVKPNLTFNLGLRYSYEQPLYEVNNKMVNVNIPLAKFAAAGTPIANLLEYAGAYNPATGKKNSRSLYNAYYFNIMPRFGFAWSINPRLILSGGYGTTDELESTGTGLRMTQNSPYQPSFTINPSIPDGSDPGIGAQVENGFSSASNSNVTGASYRAWDPDIRPSVIQQFNLTTQYQINHRTTLQVGYVGQIGKHLAVPIAINQATGNVNNCPDVACLQSIVPFYTLVGTGEVVETASRAISNYNGLQATLKQMTPWNGLTYLVNYTFSKSMTDSPGYFGVDGASSGDSYWQDINNPLGDYGPTEFDNRHNFNGILVYELPFGHNKPIGAKWNRIADEVAGGWQVSMNFSANTGFPLTITNGFSCNNNCPEQQTGDYAQHADQYRKMKIVDRGVHGGVFKWFGTDPSASANSSHGTDNGRSAYGRSGGGVNFGTAHIGTERSPGYQNYDMALQKGFRTYSEQSLKLRVDAFNAFNISSYGNPATYIGGGSNPNFGAITGTRSSPRQLQLSAIYSF